ncbi:MAG: ABC transporter permease [Planctomycetota bacterium]|nr:ABC transporter permease [Planctomycetota bacterium]
MNHLQTPTAENVSPPGRFLPLFSAMVRQREVGLLLLIALTGIVVGIKDFHFLSFDVWHDILVRCAPTAIVACGVMLVVVTGEIDISVGSLMALLAAVMGRMISENEADLSCWIGIPATLGLGTLIGLFTGSLVSLGRVPSIIVTLGLLTALRGLTTLIMGGENIDRLPEGWTQLAKQGLFGIPISILAAVGVIGLTSVLIHHIPLGRRLYALGSSAESARMVGLSEVKLKLFVFGYTGFLTALATIVDVPRLPKIESGIGSEFELLVVTCVVVGGVAISGGQGRLIGVLLAVVLMTMIRPVLTFMDIGEAGEKWTRAIQGLFILLAVVSDSLFSQRQRRSGKEHAA